MREVRGRNSSVAMYFFLKIPLAFKETESLVDFAAKFITCPESYGPVSLLSYCALSLFKFNLLLREPHNQSYYALDCPHATILYNLS